MNDWFNPVGTCDMLPVIIGDCRGWFHQSAAEFSKSTAILCCAGAGQDYTNGYRPFRLLAAQLAKMGYSVLRFDYPGVGDSNDIESLNLWEEWQNSTVTAAAWLKDRAAVDQIVLVGVRIGALLAADVAAKLDSAAGLVLIEPCLRGRSYVSQLLVEARLRGWKNGEGDVEVGELFLIAECLDAMRQVDLAQLPFQSDLPIITFSQTAPEKIRNHLAPLKKRGVDVICEDIGGLEAILRPSQHSGEAELDASRILEWLGRTISQCEQPRLLLPIPISSTLIHQDYDESVLCFGSKENLFGVYCQPKRNLVPDFAVLICNAGGNPHQGFGRFGTEFARSLASSGFASFRFDFAGLGDSIHLSGDKDVQTDVFTQDRSEDVADAMDTLHARGIYRFAIQGLCSGAYHAVQGGWSDARIGIVLTVNLPWFSLRPERIGPQSAAQKYIKALSCRGASTLFLFGDNEAGLKTFEKYFGARGIALAETPGVQTEVVARLDHDLTAGWMRRTVSEKIIDFLQSQVSAQR